MEFQENTFRRISKKIETIEAFFVKLSGSVLTEKQRDFRRKSYKKIESLLFKNEKSKAGCNVFFYINGNNHCKVFQKLYKNMAELLKK